MVNRREFLVCSLAGLLAGVTKNAFASKPPKLVFVHGRSQQGKDPTELKATWMDALKRGADKAGIGLPSNLEVAFPYYGDALDEFTRQNVAVLPVVETAADKRVLGLVEQRDLLKALHRAS